MRKDGSRFWGSGVMVPLKEGAPPGFVKIIRDRTLERPAAMALRQSERRFRTLLENIPQLVKVGLEPRELGVRQCTNQAVSFFEGSDDRLSLRCANSTISVLVCQVSYIRAHVQRVPRPGVPIRTSTQAYRCRCVRFLQERRVLEAAMERAHLTEADRHIAEARHRIADQNRRIGELERDGHDSSLSKDLLKTFEDTLKLMAEHRCLRLHFRAADISAAI